MDTIILLLTYNNQDTLRKSLDDLLSQTYQHYEIFIFDDCSNDLTYDICLEYASNYSKINLNRNRKNLGVLENFEQALNLLQNKIIKSKYFLWACPDDEWDRLYLSSCIDKLNDMSSVVASQSYINISYKQTGFKYIQEYEDFYKDISYKNMIKIFNHLDGNGKMLCYNQCIHSVIRSDYVYRIFQLKNKLYISMLICELSIVGLFLAYGGLIIVPQVLSTKNVLEQFEKKNPKDKFALLRANKINFIKSCFSILYFLRDDLIKNKISILNVFICSFWFYVLKPIYVDLKIFIYEKCVKKVKQYAN